MSAPSPHADHVSRLMSLLEAHWVLTLATRDPNPVSDQLAPHCAPLYYASSRDPDGTPLLVFTSKPSSVHGEQLGMGPTAAGAAIYLETETVGEIRGAQLRGFVERLELDDAREAAARAMYLERHPIAASMLEGGPHRLYRMRLTWAKLTDNRLGFGVHPVLDFP